MAHRGNNRYFRRSNGADNVFIAERQQIFKRTAAASHDKHIAHAEFVCRVYLPHDRVCSFVSLYERREYDDGYAGIAPFCNLENIAERRARWTGHDTYRSRICREFTLAAFVKKSFRSEPFLALFEHLQNVSRSGDFHAGNKDLIVASCGIYRKLTGTAYKRAGFRRKRNRGCLAAEHDGADLRRIIFKGEVEVTGAARPVIGDFSFYSNGRKRALDHLFKEIGDLGNGKNFVFRQLWCLHDTILYAIADFFN